MVRSTGLVVMGGDSGSRGREFESQHQILDILLLTFIFFKTVMIQFGYFSYLMMMMGTGFTRRV